MQWKMGMRLFLFLTVWNIGYLVNCLFYKLQDLRGGGGGDEQIYCKWKNIAIKTLYKLISKDFVPNTRADLVVFFYDV